MKILQTIILFFIPLGIFAQTNFSNGYKKGFKEGFCYQSKQNGNGTCLEPIPPSSPFPNISNGESAESYKDGYHKGFEDGKAEFVSNSKNESSYNKPRKYPEIYEYTDIDILAMVNSARTIDNLKRGNAYSVDQWSDRVLSYLNQKIKDNSEYIGSKEKKDIEAFLLAHNKELKKYYHWANTEGIYYSLLNKSFKAQKKNINKYFKKIKRKK